MVGLPASRKFWKSRGIDRSGLKKKQAEQQPKYVGRELDQPNGTPEKTQDRNGRSEKEA